MPADVDAPRLPGTGRWLRLARKELREILRDRRTIITLVLMPILSQALFLAETPDSSLIHSPLLHSHSHSAPPSIPVPRKNDLIAW